MPTKKATKKSKTVKEAKASPQRGKWDLPCRPGPDAEAINFLEEMQCKNRPHFVLMQAALMQERKTRMKLRSHDKVIPSKEADVSQSRPTTRASRSRSVIESAKSGLSPMRGTSRESERKLEQNLGSADKVMKPSGSQEVDASHSRSTTRASRSRSTLSSTESAKSGVFPKSGESRQSESQDQGRARLSRTVKVARVYDEKRIDKQIKDNIYKTFTKNGDTPFTTDSPPSTGTSPKSDKTGNEKMVAVNVSLPVNPRRAKAYREKASLHLKTKRKLEQEAKNESVSDISDSDLLEEKNWRAGKSVRGSYKKAERASLYENGRFLMEVEDIDKEIGDFAIWQVEDESCSLRQYYPARYGNTQFFCSTDKRVRFSEDKFKDDTFYDRFQPIVVVVAHENYGNLPEESNVVVQFVYIDKFFFYRMAKSIGRIQSDDLRPSFMDSLPAAVLLALDPDFLAKWTSPFYSNTHQKFQKAVNAWQNIHNCIQQRLEFLMANSGLSRVAWKCLIAYPKYRKSFYGLRMMNCTACMKCRRTPMYLISFPVENPKHQPYNHQTFEKVSLDDCPPLTRPLYWCRQCAVKARQIHRLMHFQHFLIQLKRQNVAMDIKSFVDLDLEVTDAIILWIHNMDVSWKNKMFLDFQVTLAETEAIR